MASCVLPMVTGQNRCFVWDNVNAHKSNSSFVIDLVKAEGHQIVLRPKVSGDLAAIELCFDTIRNFLHSHRIDIISRNHYLHYLERAVCDTTGKECRGYFWSTGH